MKHLLRFATLVVLLAGMLSCAQQPRDIAYTMPDGEVKTIFFNLRLSSAALKDGPDRWSNRREAVLNMIERESPSVLGVQEGLIDQVDFIAENCPQFKWVGAGRDDGKHGGEIMAVFYRADYFEALDSGTFWLSETPAEVSKGWDAACRRTVTWAHLREKSTGKSFYFLNTHFDHMGEIARRQSALMLADYISSLPVDATVVAGGDLNSDISDAIFDPLKSVSAIAREISTPTDHAGTFNGFGSAPGNIVIDHIFCRNVIAPGLRVLRGDYGAPYISDHYPLSFTFALP